MTKRLFTRGTVGLALAPLLVLQLACEALLVEPSPDGREVRIQMGLSESSTASTGPEVLLEQMANVDEIQLRFSRPGYARDTTVSSAFRDGRIRARIRLRPEEAHGWLNVEAELRDRRRPLFEGSGVLRVSAVSPVLGVEITPVPATVDIGPVPEVMTALADTVALEAVVRFHFGAPIEGAEVLWSSEDGDVLEIVSDSLLVSRANGTTRVHASSGGAQGARTIRVSQVPVRMTGVGPSDTTITVGETFQLRPFGEDGNGRPLLPGADIPWVPSGPVSVNAAGLVTGTAAGSGSVHVDFESETYETLVTVLEN